MKKSTQKMAVNFLLIVVIGCILWTGYVWFIGGPARVYDDQDTQYVMKFMEKEKYEEARLVSRFSYDTVYYVIEATREGNTELAWFSRDFDRKGSHEVVGFDSVYQLADTHGVSHDSISFGVYNDKLVYVLKKSGMFEMFVSVDTLDIVFHLGGVS